MYGVELTSVSSAMRVNSWAISETHPHSLPTAECAVGKSGLPRKEVLFPVSNPSAFQSALQQGDE